MRLSFVPAPEKSACLVVFLSKKGLPDSAPSALTRRIEGFKKSFKAEKNKVLFLHGVQMGPAPSLLLAGLGDSGTVDMESFRQSASSALKELEKRAVPSATVDLSLLPSSSKGRDGLPGVVQALTEGFSLAHYHFNELKTKKPDDKVPIKNIFFTGAKADQNLKKALEEGQIIADSVNFARRLGDMPANLMTPAILAEQVRKKFLGLKGMKVSIWNKDRIKKEKMGGVLGVSSGSAQEPRVIIMEYRGLSPESKKISKPLCFVGKGLTFDSGGISIKPAKNMHEMKFDMCGSTAVIGTLLAIARLKLKVNVLGLVGSAENMPGAGAVKPGDVLTARNGKTMEVLNTDAEGRLVLADVLSYASEQKPEFIVDTATLTGAVIGALSNIYTGLFTRNASLEKKIKGAGLRSGEKIWSLPLDDFHVKDIKSEVADVANIASFWGGGSSTAGAFLEHFVDKDIPWAHLDIAGTAWNVHERLPYCRPQSASGVMVRTFVEMARLYNH